MGQESGRAWLGLLFRVSQNCKVSDSWTAFLSGTQDQIYLYIYIYVYISVQSSSVAQSCPTLCNPMDCSTPGLPVHHQLPEFTQTHVHWVSDAVQPSHPLSSPSPPAFNLSQHQGLFQWVSSLHQVAKVLALQLQHESSQWTPTYVYRLGWVSVVAQALLGCRE